MIKSKNLVYWLLKIKNPTHQIDENLGLNPGWVFWFSSLRREIFYEFDYFHDFDYHSLVSNTCSHSYSSYYACYILKVCYILSMINIVDIFIIFRIAISVKSKTLSVTSLLTSKALEQRKR